jgi:hypothetical protein
MDENVPTPASRFFRRLFVFGSAATAISYIAVVHAAAEAALLIGILVTVVGLIGWSLNGFK